MRQHHDLRSLSATTRGWLEKFFGGQRRPAGRSLTFTRKLTPIDEVVARIGREWPTAD
jgi:hypothetical protein